MTDYLTHAGLLARPGGARLPRGRLRLHHLHRQQRPAARRRVARPSTTATWSPRPCSRGNRNFEGRINPDVRANYLASPPLVVAYALAGTRRHRPDHASRSARAATASPVYLRDIWPTQAEVADARGRQSAPRCSGSSYANVFAGNPTWNAIAGAGGRPVRAGTPTPPTSRSRPSSRASTAEPRAAAADIRGARVLAVLGDSVTTDHISPAGTIAADSPAGRYLLEQRRAPSGLQLLRLAARQPRGDDARHLRQHPPQEPAWCPASKAA